MDGYRDSGEPRGRRLRLSRALRAGRRARPQPRPHTLLVVGLPGHRGAAPRRLPGAAETVAPAPGPGRGHRLLRPRGGPAGSSPGPPHHAGSRRPPQRHQAAGFRRRRGGLRHRRRESGGGIARRRVALPRGAGSGRRDARPRRHRRSHALARADHLRGRRRRAPRPRRRRLAAGRAAARSRRGARGFRAGRGGAGRARDGTRLRARPLRLRAAHRLLPGHQAQARRRVRRRRAGALQRLLRRLGAVHRGRRAAGGGGSSASGRERGLLPRRQGEYPDPRRHGLHLGVRLPHVLSPRQAARADARQPRALEGQAHHAPPCPGAGGEHKWTSPIPLRKRSSAGKRARGWKRMPSAGRYAGRDVEGALRRGRRARAGQGVAGEEACRRARRHHLGP